MRLRELEPIFYRHSIGIAAVDHGRSMLDGTTQWGGFEQSIFIPCAMSEADRIMFLCPKCFVQNGGNVGTHSIAVDFIGRQTPDSACIKNDKGIPVRWNIIDGSDYDDLQLAPSILILGGCGWHGFVGTNGAAPGEVVTV